MRLVLSLGLLVLGLDQLTKLLALARLTPGHSVPVVDGFFALTLVLNPGLAFGFLSATPPGWRWLVALLSLTALGVLLGLSARLLPTGGWPAAVALGFIFGGATGNLIDRYRFGAVVDFIDLYWRSYHWPAFNLADSAISVGVGLLAVRLLRPSRQA
jgi:signal peptidase II